MNKKVIFNGIELSLPKYDESTVTVFDYLDKVANNLQDGLGEEDGSFRLSLDVDFSANTPPKHKILSNGLTSQKTKAKVARILENMSDVEQEQFSGTVRVNILVDDRE